MQTQISQPKAAAQDSAARHVNDLFDSLQRGSAVDGREFKQLIDHVPIAIVASKQMGGEHQIVYENKCFEAKTRRSAKEIIGKDWSCLNCFRHEDDPDVTIESALRHGGEFLGTFSLAEPSRLLFEAYARGMQDDNATYQIVALVDATVRESVRDEEHAKQLRFKDVLFNEIQHRVRNNLQLIAVLIRLEARSARLGEQINLDRLAGRISSMKFLYDELSPNPAAETIDLAHYLSNIASGAMRTNAVEGIRLDLQVESISVSVNIAMPLGLIVNELLTNAFKYAFSGKVTGTITVHCLPRGEGWHEVMVADDGVGYPPGVRWPMEGKLGALVFHTLAENVKTDLQFDSHPGKGTRITIAFDHVLRRAMPGWFAHGPEHAGMSGTSR